LAATTKWIGLGLGLALAGAGAGVVLVSGEAECREGTAGCPCRFATCDAGLRCYGMHCWGGAHPPPDSYYYTQQNLDDIMLVRRIIYQHWGLEPGMKVVDLGAGQCQMAIEAARLVQPSGRVYATDIDPKILEICRESAQSAAKAHLIEVRQAAHERDTAVDDLPAGSIDLTIIVNSMVLQTTGDEREDVAYLARLRRVMKPGGRVIYHYDWIASPMVPHAKVKELFARAGFGPAQELPLPAHVPERTMAWFGGPRLPSMQLERGFIYVFPNPAPPSAGAE
jgi:SAM-dependent methyltransferase